MSKDNEVLNCGIENEYQINIEDHDNKARDKKSRDALPGNQEVSRDDELSYVVEEAPELDNTMSELRVETMEVAKVAR